MTALEKFKQLYPDSNLDVLNKACPYLKIIGAKQSTYCSYGENPDDCKRCWNQEIPEKESKE